MHLSGRLSDWSINDLLQIMQVTKKTGSLDIDGTRRGRIHFRDGAVTGAELSDGRQGLSSEDRGGVADVIFVLNSLEEGSFSVGSADGPDAPGWSVEDVQADVEVLRALETEVTDAGMFEVSGIRIRSDVEDPMTLEAQDWKTLVSLIQPFTFEQLETKFGRGGAVRTFHTLHRLGVAAAVTADEDESVWLDRLADDISPEVAEEETPAPVQYQEPEPILAAPEPERPEDEETETTTADTEDMRGVAAPASTTLTDGVYDEIRRLRSKVAER